ncbi:hypothetical protein B0H16DRAFT_1462921 [Mycena metata]|uniref:Uncharacterized protein n=1 Tax=Mycena metata TaxID=1033252 RepID=A0AAD7IKE5_9AGAR|nr:hypothetical protein B0H16DRAFT_1462921 [Mycena metata]
MGINPRAAACQSTQNSQMKMKGQLVDARMKFNLYGWGHKSERPRMSAAEQMGRQRRRQRGTGGRSDIMHALALRRKDDEVQRIVLVMRVGRRLERRGGMVLTLPGVRNAGRQRRETTDVRAENGGGSTEMPSKSPGAKEMSERKRHECLDRLINEVLPTREQADVIAGTGNRIRLRERCAGAVGIDEQAVSASNDAPQTMPDCRSSGRGGRERRTRWGNKIEILAQFNMVVAVG